MVQHGTSHGNLYDGIGNDPKAYALLADDNSPHANRVLCHEVTWPGNLELCCHATTADYCAPDSQLAGPHDQSGPLLTCMTRMNAPNPIRSLKEVTSSRVPYVVLSGLIPSPLPARPHGRDVSSDSRPLLRPGMGINLGCGPKVRTRRPSTLQTPVRQYGRHPYRRLLVQHS
jgi:hypothetical protein